MGYRGKVAERAKARELRAEGMTLLDIATELGVAKSSVSEWVRDVEFTPSKRRYGPRVRPNALQQRKLDEIEEMLEAGRERIGTLADREFIVAGAALYAGEGAKTDGCVKFVNTDPRMVEFFLMWFRRFFLVDELRLRLTLYLHDGLDLDAASHFWADLTGIPFAQHNKAYRAVPDHSIRHSKHPLGCATVAYSCSRTHREIMGMIDALLTCELPSGVAQSAARAAVNR